MVILTGFRFCYPLSTEIFSATDGPICGLDSHDKSSWNEDDLRMPYCCKGAINSRVIGLGTWYGVPKSRQRGGKLMYPS